MAYTKQVREYCLKNQGAVLDVSLVKDGEFSEIPYKTLLKILNRLEEEKLIFGISKGVYAIGKLNVQDEPDIVREYTENGKEWLSAVSCIKVWACLPIIRLLLKSIPMP